MYPYAIYKLPIIIIISWENLIFLYLWPCTESLETGSRVKICLCEYISKFIYATASPFGNLPSVHRQSEMRREKQSGLTLEVGLPDRVQLTQSDNF